MTILNDPKSVDRFQPDDGRIVYFLKIPTVADRVKFRHAVKSEGGGYWTELQMIDAMEEGLRRILTEPEDKEALDRYVVDIQDYRQQVSSVIDDYRQAARDQTPSEEAEGDDQVEFIKSLVDRMAPPASVAEVDRILLEHYPKYSRMVADRMVYQEVAGLVAARMFLVGWEGIDAKFRRTLTGVPDSLLSHLPPQHLVQIGARIQQLLEPSVNKLKNLRSRSGGRGGQDRSSTSETPPESNPSSTTTGPATSSESPNSESTP